MQIESVRALKEEIFAESLNRHAVIRSALPREAVVRASALPMELPRSPIALGITGGDDDYRLAVRIREVTPGLQRNIDRIVARAHGEVSIRITGHIAKQQPPRNPSKQRPLQIGSSVGHFAVTAGTIGCFVATDGSARHILSSNHVLANENLATLGDPILQPGPFDHGILPEDTVAKLSAFEPLLSDSKNLVDAAIAAIDGEISEDRATLTDLGTVSGLRIAPLQEGLRVFKLGRTTGLTRGQVSAFEVDDVWVEYDMGEIGFDRQIEIAPLDASPFSLGGDSGSLIVDEELQAVGLLFAGNDVDVTYANPLDEVLRVLGVQLIL